MGIRGGELWGLLVGEFGVTQRLVVSRAQLLAFGVTDMQIKRALAQGRLHRIHWGVYALVPLAALPPLAREQAALLACGPTAVLSHHTAARLHGLPSLIDSPKFVTLTVAQDRRVPGVTIHRRKQIDPRHVHRIQRLPTTSVARTVADLSPTLSDRALEHLIDAALKKTSRAKLLEQGTPRMRALLDPQRPSADTWSKAEERLLHLIREAGLPLPESNVRIETGHVPDLLWREHKLIVEYDSVAHHSGPAAFHDDRARHNALTAAGYTVLHVTWRDLHGHPGRVLVWIAQALARAAAA